MAVLDERIPALAAPQMTRDIMLGQTVLGPQHTEPIATTGEQRVVRDTGSKLHQFAN